jgi:hypothetical protein
LTHAESVTRRGALVRSIKANHSLQSKSYTAAEKSDAQEWCDGSEERCSRVVRWQKGEILKSGAMAAKRDTQEWCDGSEERCSRVVRWQQRETLTTTSLLFTNVPLDRVCLHCAREAPTARLIPDDKGETLDLEEIGHVA